MAGPRPVVLGVLDIGDRRMAMSYRRPIGEITNQYRSANLVDLAPTQKRDNLGTPSKNGRSPT